MTPDTTSFPGSLFSASLGRWKKDPGCGWSRDHPESGWQKNMLGGRGGRVFCLLLWQTNPLAVAKNYSFYRRSKSNLPMKNATRFLPSSKYRRLWFTKKFGSQIEQKLLTVSKCKNVKGHVTVRSETSGSVLWIFEFGGNLFSYFCGFFEC